MSGGRARELTIFRMSAEPAAGRWEERPLWVYFTPYDSSTYSAIVAALDHSSEVPRGDFVLGMRTPSPNEPLDRYFDALVCNGPGAVRHLRNLAVPRSLRLPHGEEGTFQRIDSEAAPAVWAHVFDHDPGAREFVERLAAGKTWPPEVSPLAAELFAKPPLDEWHRAPIARALAVAHAHGMPLSPLILLAAYLHEPGDSETLRHAGELIRGKHPTLFDALGLTRAGIETMDVPISGEPSIDPQSEAVLREYVDGLSKLGRRNFARARDVLAFLLSSDQVIAHLKSVDLDASSLRSEILARPPEAESGHGGEFGIETIVSRDMWTLQDHLGYGVYACAITESLLKGDTQPPLTIGIQAPWGQGKTSLMRMMQDTLDPGASQREEQRARQRDVRTAIRTTYEELRAWTARLGRGSAEPPAAGMVPVTTRNDGLRHIPTVWFNPLYYRDTSQVWAGMAHAILHQLVGRLDAASRELFWFRLQQTRINVEAIRRDVHRTLLINLLPVGATIAAVSLAVLVLVAVAPQLVTWLPWLAGGGVASTVLGAALKWIRENRKPIDRKFEDYVTEPNYRSELGLLHLIDHDLDRALELLVGRDRPIAVFIDDLDRCDPQTVNQVILAVNQFLSLPHRRVFFFLGMDMEMVAAALEQAQKDALGGTPLATSYRRSFGWRFMEKFVQLPFVIPHLDEDTAKAFAESHLRRGRAEPEHQAASEAEVEQIVQQVQAATTPTVVGELMKRLETAPAGAKAAAQQAASVKVADLMKNSESTEMRRIAEIAIEDLDLNPRTIVRYFCLVRVLRNVQLATGQSGDPDEDRKIVLRAAHLLMNWPQFVQWLRNEPEVLTLSNQWKPTVDVVAGLAARAENAQAWAEGMGALLRREKSPDYLADASLYRYLRKLAASGPGLQTLYQRRMF